MSKDDIGLLRTDPDLNQLAEKLTDIRDRGIAVLGAKLDQDAKLFQEVLEVVRAVIDQADMPFRCRCGEMATLQTGHGNDCAVTKAQALITRIEDRLKETP